MQIKIDNVSFIYSKGLPYETKALTDVNFTCEEGDFVALIGCTGSGKTTLAELICGLAKPSEGQIFVDGIDLNDKSKEAKEARKHIGIVFQYPEYQLFEETVLKDVMFGPRNHGIEEAECEKLAKDALALVGLTDEEYDKSPFSLSGGQKRRVAIAGVLAMEPKVLILDEPSAGLDPKGHNDILDMIQKIKVERNMTIILVSHDMNDVAEFANKIAVLKRGRLVMYGTPREVFGDKEKLTQAGLSLPSGALLLEELRERGMSINSNVLNIDETAEEIIRALK